MAEAVLFKGQTVGIDAIGIVCPPVEALGEEAIRAVGTRKLWCSPSTTASTNASSPQKGDDALGRVAAEFGVFASRT